jgi:hypothetical protein
MNTCDPVQEAGPVQPTLIKKKELAKRLSVSTRSIDGWVSKRVIPYIQITPRFYLYEFDAVLAALKKHYQVDPKVRD